MEERTASCSVLLIGENPSDTSVIERAILNVRPKAPVSVARHHQDAARALSSCEQGTFRVAFFIPTNVDDAELLTLIRSSPAGGSARLVVLLHDPLADNTKPFYQRGAHSVIRWPNDPDDQTVLADRLALYWEEMNLPLLCTEQKAPQIAVL